MSETPNDESQLLKEITAEITAELERRSARQKRRSWLLLIQSLCFGISFAVCGNLMVYGNEHRSVQVTVLATIAAVCTATSFWITLVHER